MKDDRRSASVWGESMGQAIKIELEMDQECHEEMRQEAQRLGLTPEEFAKRAIAAWMTDIRENSCFDQQSQTR